MALHIINVEETVLGSFVEKSEGQTFEYGVNNDPIAQEYPHKVFVEGGYRYARVLNTVVHIAVDEDEDGFVEEKWFIKNRRKYQK